MSVVLGHHEVPFLGGCFQGEETFIRISSGIQLEISKLNPIISENYSIVGDEGSFPNIISLIDPMVCLDIIHLKLGDVVEDEERSRILR